MHPREPEKEYMLDQCQCCCFGSGGVSPDDQSLETLKAQSSGLSTGNLLGVAVTSVSKHFIDL